MNLCRQPIYRKETFTDAMEKAFLAWLRTLPCCVTNADAPSDPAHVRRITQGAAIACKPKLYAVPLCHEVHAYQHQHGEAACLATYAGLRLSVEKAKQWFDNKAFFHREVFLDKIWGKQ